jgi:DNA segregation ATPase FtsK/SpoIIIE, S-DNA-T family
LPAPPRKSSAARTTARSRSSTSRKAAASKPAPQPRKRKVMSFRIAPDTWRSLLGVALLVAGAVTLVALALPTGGILNRYVDGFLRPFFGQGAWLLAVLLLVAGALVERAPTVGNGWGVAAIGGLIVFIGAEGLIHLIWGTGSSRTALAQGGGQLGSFFSSNLSDLVSPVGAFVILVGVCVGGVLLLFNLTLRSLLRPVATGGKAVASVASATYAAARVPVEERTPVAVPVAVGGAGESRGRRRAAYAAAHNGNGSASTNGSAPRGTPEAMPEPDLPVPQSSPVPLSQTVWDSGRAARESSNGGRLAPAGTVAAGGSLTVVATAPEVGGIAAAAATGAARGSAVAVALDDMKDGAGTPIMEVVPAPVAPRPRVWELPPIELLDEEKERVAASSLDHQRNVRIIEEKLRSFQIPAVVVGTNTGPVVTQYEVKPDVRVKLSRIEALADDLAMALAARSIRIEAPIPGRDVVGIEIPNHASEVVSFRGLYEDAKMAEATSKLTFALGRDVSGKAYAVDLARMPHLLIAGATGSGKSVCVNALITSLLMRARPDEVKLVLVDLKRVELAPYDGLPHLMTHVVVEAHDARNALGWAVREMENRYKLLAAKGERNIGAYNDSPRIERDDRLPYIVIIIDELADLIMREGRKVEDPIVKIAQKARAVGIHLVLATQRPSVNVVTGLIKANVPSRVAFAMASNVDSRTVLDAPGAEDLIGRGDMLYQPADLPRPVRLQGVFVSDDEVRAVADFWRMQDPEPGYDPDVLAGADEEGEGGGQFGWLAQMAEDDMTPRAAELITQTGKASTSMLQTKLKLGFNRASRVMDELERFGVVGPQDPRNPAVPRQVYGPDNWMRSTADVDRD